MRTSAPGIVRAFIYRAHRYFSDENPKSLTGEVKFFKKKQLREVVTISLNATRDQFGWRMHKFDQEVEVDEIEFPPHFDFDNIHFSFVVKKVWEVAKLDYLKR